MQLVIDLDHAVDAGGGLGGPVGLFPGIDPATELHHALVGFDVDPGAAEEIVAHQLGLDLRLNGRVVDVLAGRAVGPGGNADQECGEDRENPVSRVHLVSFLQWVTRQKQRLIITAASPG